jgi:hypothetical protein
MCFAAFESLLQIDVARVFLTNFVFILIVIDDLIEVDYPERVHVSSSYNTSLRYSTTNTCDRF